MKANSDEITRRDPAPGIYVQVPEPAGSASLYIQNQCQPSAGSAQFSAKCTEGSPSSLPGFLLPGNWKCWVEGGLGHWKEPGFLGLLWDDFFLLLLQLNRKDPLRLLCSVAVWNQSDNERAQRCRKACKTLRTSSMSAVRRCLAFGRLLMLGFDSVDIQHPYSMFL